MTIFSRTKVGGLQDQAALNAMFRPVHWPQSHDDEKVSIQVVALTAGGENVVSFKMKPSSRFEKVMEAWCKEQSVLENDVSFEFNGKELSPNDTPASCFWKARKGVMRINAKRREEKLENQTATALAEVSQKARAPTRVEVPQAQDVQEQQGTLQSHDAEKVFIQVVALAEGGENAVDFKMKSSSRFEKMMKAWCKCNRVPESDALFEFNGKELSPNDTPASCPWNARKGVMRINAKPREEKLENQTATAPAEVSQKARAPTRVEVPQGQDVQEQPDTLQSHDDEKVSIQVVALAEGGENLADFKMKSSSRFEKMMKAWCKCNRVPESDALFEFNGKELSPNDTPASCSWNAQKGVMRINAKPREEKLENQTATAPAEVSQKARAPTRVEVPQGQDVQEQPDTLQSHDDEKVSIQVVALAEGGENLADFKMKSSSRFEKMMKAWCKCNRVPESDALFEFNGKELSPNDTPASCSWNARKGVMRINAKPREEKLENQTATALAEVSQKARAPTRVEVPQGQDVQEQPDTLQSHDDEKVSIQVVALAEGGENLVDFKMKSSSRFEKMMKAWCKCKRVPESDAVFEFNGKELSPNDTPASCSWNARKGVMRINAKPREEKLENQTATAPAEVSQKARTSTRVKVAQGQDVQEQQGTLQSHDDEKVFIQVVALAEGTENLFIFKMKSSSPFQKMMTEWRTRQSVPESDAVFELNGRELSPDDTPASCSWNARDGVMRIKAKPREEKMENQTATGQDVQGQPDTLQSHDETDKVEILLLPRTDSGQTAEVHFKMKPDSPFQKMMKAWCDFQRVPASSTSFEFGCRKLSPNDTPASCLWKAGYGVMRINAKPREEKLENQVATAPAEVSQMEVWKSYFLIPCAPERVETLCGPVAIM